MKKRFVAVLLSAMMVLALLSVNVLAVGEVAEVEGGSQYTTLQEAINAAAGTEAAKILLLGQVTESVTIPTGANITLDLNGQTLTGAAADAIYVASGATLKVTGTGTVQASAGGYAAVFNNGMTTLSGGTYTRSGGQWYTVVNHGTMIIETGVTVNTMSDAVSSLVENGYYSYTGANERNNYVSGVNSAAPTLTINGGSFNTAGYNAVKNDEGGVLNIYEGNFTSQRADGGVIMNWNQVAIYGGTFTATSENTAVISNGTYGSYANGQARIEGGTFIVAEGSNAKIFGYGEGSGTGGTMTVSNANFDGDFGGDLSAYYEINIENCASTEPVPAYMTADGKGQIGLTAAGTTTYYVGAEDALQAAAKNAASGDAIEVLSGDLTLTDLPNGVTVTNSGSGTVVANGQTVTDTPVTVHVHSLTAVEAKAATCTEAGNVAYWKCDGCDKLFKDGNGTEEITDVAVPALGHKTELKDAKEATCTEAGYTGDEVCTVCGETVKKGEAIPAKGHDYKDGVCTVCGAKDPDFAPEIVKGAGASWQKTGKSGLSFTSNAAFADFLKVQVDGKDVDKANYEVKEGSTIVTLKASYLETLSVGKHTLAIMSSTGTASTTFTIKAAPTGAPATGDNSMVVLWAALAVLSAGGAMLLTVRKKRTEQ